jgi:hypothetical protein
MKLHLDWSRPVRLKVVRNGNMIYDLGLEKVPPNAGVYIFGRKWHRQFESLYVGKAANIRSRVKRHLNNLHLMRHLQNAKQGKRIVLAGTIVTKPGQRRAKCLEIAERALIRYFLAEGHDLVNKQGTKIRRHELESDGTLYLPKLIYLEKVKGV